MPRKHTDRPAGSEPPGRSEDGRPGGANNDQSVDHAIVFRKRGRLKFMGKIVHAHPLDQVVLATPYGKRQAVEVVSLPPRVITHARNRGVKLWIVRRDTTGDCFALPLAEVERLGWMQGSHGIGERFVPLSSFRKIGWQDWAYTRNIVDLSDRGREPSPWQLDLFGDGEEGEDE